MDIDTFKPTFVIQIEGQTLSADITQEITSFVFEDNEEELDVLELAVTDRNLQFVDDPLFQEGNEIVARFGYVGNLSPRKKAVIKDIDYDFPEDGDPTIHIKAYDKGFKLAGKENQRVWQKPAPGILYSEIAEEIAGTNGLSPVVTPTKARHLRVTQSNVSDAQFLKELAGKARDKDGDGVTGYVFYIQDDKLHFHPRDLDKKPAAILEYFTDRKGVLRSFRPSTQSQGAKGAGVYYCHSVRHAFGEGGYHCELKLKKNALGKGAGDKSDEAKGKQNDQEAPPTPKEEPPPMVTIDADSGRRL